MKRFFLAKFKSMYLLFPTGVVAALDEASAETEGGVEKGGVEKGRVERSVGATGTVALDISEDVDESTGSFRGSNLPWKGRMITGVGSTLAGSLVEVESALPGW